MKMAHVDSSLYCDYIVVCLIVENECFLRIENIQVVGTGNSEKISDSVNSYAWEWSAHSLVRKTRQAIWFMACIILSLLNNLHSSN